MKSLSNEVGENLLNQRDASPITARPELAYFAFSFLSSLNTGAYLVLVSWTATELSGDASLAGALFFLSLIFGLISANVAGVTSDRSDPRNVLLAANLIRLIGSAILFIAFSNSAQIIAGLVAFTIMRAVGGVFIGTAGVNIFQMIFSKEVRTRKVAEVSICNQIGIASGSGLAGIFLVQFGAFWLSAILAFFTVIQTPLIFLFTTRALLRNSSRSCPQKEKRDLFFDWRQGFRYVVRNRRIGVSLVVMAAAFSVAQLTNTLVPSFVMNDLKMNSSSYGALEASWAEGGTLVLLFVRRLSGSASSHRSELTFLGLTGVVMVLFALNRTIEIAFVLYFVLGALFSITRTLANGHLMTETENGVVGRVAAIGQLLTNLIGAGIFSLPWFISTSTVTNVYVSWGAVMLTITAVTLVLSRRRV